MIFCGAISNFHKETVPEEGICFKMFCSAVVAIDPKWFHCHLNPTGAPGCCRGVRLKSFITLQDLRREAERNRQGIL